MSIHPVCKWQSNSSRYKQQATQEALLVSPWWHSSVYLVLVAVFLQASWLHLQSEAVQYEMTCDCTKERGRLFKWTFGQIRLWVVKARGSHWTGTENGGGGNILQRATSERTTYQRSWKEWKRVDWKCWWFSWKCASNSQVITESQISSHYYII